jgi:hypothetical protein
MKITIDHDKCNHSGFFAEKCLAATLRSPLGHERSCMAAIEEDGRPEVTVILIEDGKEQTIILHNEDEQQAAALGALTGLFQQSSANS